MFDTITFLENSGASAIEVGIPWSDPVADGPVIELAGQRSLANGENLTAIVQKLQEKQTTVPLVIMTYINPVYQYGIEKFIADLKNTSVKGLIIPDLPHEHENMVKPYLTDTDIALVPLVSLTTGIERQKKTLCKDAEGFIYAVAINGVTGKTGNYRDDLDKHLTNLKAIADIPVLVLFVCKIFDFQFHQVLVSQLQRTLSALTKYQMVLLSEQKLLETYTKEKQMMLLTSSNTAQIIKNKLISAKNRDSFDVESLFLIYFI